MKKARKLALAILTLGVVQLGHSSQLLAILGCCNTVVSVAGSIAGSSGALEGLKENCHHTGVLMKELNEKILDGFENMRLAFQASCQRTREKWIRWQREQRTQWTNFSSQMNLCSQRMRRSSEDLVSSIQRRSSRQNTSFQRRYS